MDRSRGARAATMLSCAAAFVALAATSCGGEAIDVVDPATIPQNVTYTEHIAPMMSFYCEACHSPDAQTGVVEGKDYSTYEKTRRNFDDLEESA